MILLDTNIILRSKQKHSTHFHGVVSRLLELADEEEELVVCPQVIYEFYVVATRPPNKNGLGLSTINAKNEIDNILETYYMPPEDNRLFYMWRKIIADYNVSGKNAHDARIVAFMIMHGIKKLYTLNLSDFARFNSIIDFV